MEKRHQWDEIQVPMERVARFVRQMAHDIRNGLSAIDLEAAFIAEIATDPEVSEEIRKLREMVSTSAAMLRELSGHFQPVVLHEIPWQARIFFQELQRRVETLFPEEKRIAFESTFTSESASIFVDLEQLISAIIHGVSNAVQFGHGKEEPIRIGATLPGDGSFYIEIVEARPEGTMRLPVEQWGAAPLLSTRSGGYGLGLWKMQEIVAAHGGDVERHLGESLLRTRIILPEYHDQERPV